MLPLSFVITVSTPIRLKKAWNSVKEAASDVWETTKEVAKDVGSFAAGAVAATFNAVAYEPMYMAGKAAGWAETKISGKKNITTATENFKKNNIDVTLKYIEGLASNKKAFKAGKITANVAWTAVAVYDAAVMVKNIPSAVKNAANIIKNVPNAVENMFSNISKASNVLKNAYEEGKSLSLATDIGSFGNGYNTEKAISAFKTGWNDTYGNKAGIMKLAEETRSGARGVVDASENYFEVNPKDINFSQNSINSAFDTPKGKMSIDKVVKQGSKQVEDFPPISVVDVKGQLVARDGNSRLYVARATKADKIKVVIETEMDNMKDFTSRLRKNGLPNTGTNKLPKRK